QRGLSNEDLATGDELLHVAEKEREEQGPNVRTVDIGIGHDDDFAVAELRDLEVFTSADTGADGGYHGADFFVPEHFVVARFFDVEDLAFERQNRLVTAIAARLSGATRGFAFNEEQFTAVGILFLAVCKFAGQAAGIEGALAAGEIARLTGGLPGA